MSEPKFKVGQYVYVLFFENKCRKHFRSDYDYNRKSLRFPVIGHIKEIVSRNEEDGNLYAVEFKEQEANQIRLKLEELIENNAGWDADCGLHDCGGTAKSRCGRWILEDAMRPYIENTSNKSTSYSILQKVLTNRKRKETGNEALS